MGLLACWLAIADRPSSETGSLVAVAGAMVDWAAGSDMVKPEYSIGIVAHVDRIDLAHKLSVIVDAKLLNPDDGTLGCSGNHGFVQARLASEPGWSVILEDDAMPCNAFYDDLMWCLEHAPCPIVSLYLGTGYPANWQRRMQEAVAADTSWIISNRLLHAVGYAVAPEIKGDLARWMAANKRGPGMAPDEAVSVWANKHQHKVAYTNPSLVDHRDGPTVMRTRRSYTNIVAGRNRPRHAWNTTAREHWDDSCVEMLRG